MTADQQTLPRTMANMPMPSAIHRLPRNAQGYPIPWFVAELPDGTRDFRIADQEKRYHARVLDLCWICGQANGTYKAFAIGPMCSINRLSAEPPAHRHCATYAARCCPFMATPQMVRRETGLPDDIVQPAGNALKRNPGVTLVWTTKKFEARRAPLGQPGWLWHLGDPTSLDWYCQGRTATRAEVLAAIDSGLPALREACDQDDDPEYSHAMLTLEHTSALTLVPAA